MARLRDMDGWDAEAREHLLRAGVRTTEKLLRIGFHRRGRQDLAAIAHAPERWMLRWVHVADMLRVRGIGAGYAGLLASAGVASLRQLGARRPDHLHRSLADEPRASRHVRRRPSRAEVERWVREARKLRSKVE